MRPLLALALAFSLAGCNPPPPQNAPQGPSPRPSPNGQAPVIRVANAAISVSDAWAPPTIGAGKVAAGYVKIRNGGATPDRLIAASSPRAGAVELHTMAMDGAMMKMRRLDAVEIPARGEVTLAPGGDHLMFFDLTAPLRAGEAAPLVLTFEKAGPISTTLQVRPRETGGHGRP